MGLFVDRSDAGRRLAEKLKPDPSSLVLALSLGGAVIGFEIARRLQCPLDVLLTCKMVAPSNPGLCIGVLAGGTDSFLDEPLIQALGISPEYVDGQISSHQAELSQACRRVRRDREPLPLQGRRVIVTDEGISSGYSARAAIQAATRQGPARICLAVPVVPSGAVAHLSALVDEVVCVKAPDLFLSVGDFYASFRPVSEAEAADLLSQAAAVPWTGDVRL